MFAAIRAFAKSWVAVVLFAVLIFSFALFGIRDVFNHGSVSDAVIKAGPRTVNSAEFKREFESAKAEAEQRYGQPITPQMAADNGLDRQILDGLATREAFAALLQKIGLHASDKLVVAQIAKIQAFFNPVTGQFDKQQYQQRLGENGLTPDRFEGIMRDQLAQQHLITSLGNGLEAPRAYSAMAAIYEVESRDIAYFSVDPSKVPPVPPPTDDQLNGFIKQNAAQLTRPEFRQLTVVHFGPELVKGELPIDQAKLQKLYDFRKDTLSSPETRTIVQIPAKDDATARKIGGLLAQGQTPQAAAKAVGVEAITYAQKPQSVIADRRVGDAAFKMQAGQASPVQGDLGLAVVQVVAIQPGHAVTLEQARPALEAELRKDAAAEKVYGYSQAYDDAHQKGATLAEAAQKAGVPTITLGPISKQGADVQGRPSQGLPPKLLDTAFSLPAGGESDIVDAGQGQYFAVRVDKVIPPSVPPLAEIKPQLTRFWMMREMAKRLEGRADELAARVKKGESLEAVAASAGATVSRLPGLDRRTAGQNPAVSQYILAKAFTSKPGDVFTAQGSGFAFVVGKLVAIHAGDTALLGQATEQTRAPMTDSIFREMGEGARNAAKAKMKVKIDYNRARTAIGLEPLDAKGQTKAPGSASGLAK
jgi:peptidyl-prolyl cis-trans isomerase D